MSVRDIIEAQQKEKKRLEKEEKESDRLYEYKSTNKIRGMKGCLKQEI